MAQTCKGLCLRFKQYSVTGNFRYSLGQKWCSLCALFMFSERNLWPCCKTRLRSKSRSKKNDLPRMQP